MNLAVVLTPTADRALAVHKGVAIKACLLFQAGEVAGFPVLASAIVVEHVGIPALRPDVGMSGRIGERDLYGTADGLVPRRSGDGGCAIGDSGNSAVSGDGGNKGVAGEPSDLFLWVADGSGQFLLFFRLGQGQLSLIQGEGQFRNLHGDLTGGRIIAVLGGGGDVCRAVGHRGDCAAFAHGGNRFVVGLPGYIPVGGIGGHKVHVQRLLIPILEGQFLKVQGNALHRSGRGDGDYTIVCHCGVFLGTDSDGSDARFLRHYLPSTIPARVDLHNVRITRYPFHIRVRGIVRIDCAVQEIRLVKGITCQLILIQLDTSHWHRSRNGHRTILKCFPGFGAGSNSRCAYLQPRDLDESRTIFDLIRVSSPVGQIIVCRRFHLNDRIIRRRPRNSLFRYIIRFIYRI